MNGWKFFVSLASEDLYFNPWIRAGVYNDDYQYGTFALGGIATDLN